MVRFNVNSVDVDSHSFHYAISRLRNRYYEFQSLNVIYVIHPFEVLCLPVCFHVFESLWIVFIHRFIPVVCFVNPDITIAHFRNVHVQQCTVFNDLSGADLDIVILTIVRDIAGLIIFGAIRIGTLL